MGQSKVMRISRQSTPLYITIGQKQLESVQQLEYLGILVTDDRRSTKEIRARIAAENPPNRGRCGSQTNIEMLCSRRVEKIKQAREVKNEYVPKKVKEQRKILEGIRRRNRSA